MKTIGVINYHWQRRWGMSLIFILVVCAITAITATALLHGNRVETTMVNAQGQVVVHVGYENVSFTNNPEELMNASAFSFLVMLLSVAILSRDRRFLVSLSVPRYRIWLGSFLFMLGISIALAILGGLLLPIVARLLLMLFGVPIRGGWSLGAVLTANNPHLWRDLVIEFCSMIFTCGLLTFTGYLLLRWWKVFLILFGAGIVLLILLINMIQWETYLTGMLIGMADWLRDFLMDFVPKMIDFFENGDRLRLALIQLGIGLGFTALSYPVMRGMPVR